MSQAIKPVWKILLVLAAVIALALISRGTAAQEVIPWRTDLAAARADAAASQKPMFLYFTASWCDPCRQMKQTTWADPKVATAMERAIPVKVDVDDDAATASLFKVNSVPAMFLLNSEGEIVKQQVGWMSSNEVIWWLGR